MHCYSGSRQSEGWSLLSLAREKIGMQKPVDGVSDQVRQKLGCTTTEE